MPRTESSESVSVGQGGFSAPPIRVGYGAYSPGPCWIVVEAKSQRESMVEPIVDILIPVYNGASTVRESVNSIRHQTMRNIRIIVVDDGSIDLTPQILAELAREDPRILVVNKPNGGIVEALNLGLRHCRAEFVARFDADDIAYNHRLDIQVAYLLGHPECVAVGGAIDHIDERGAPIGRVSLSEEPGDGEPAWVPAREPYLIHPFLMVRRSIIERLGGYRYVHNTEDSDLCWRLSEHGRLHNLSVSLGQYRMHSSSISGSSVLNGRIMAISSQLAALSAVRRRTQRSDLEFTAAARDQYRSAVTLQNIYDLARRDLEADEADYLRIAAAAKLMELTYYRPYELEHSDCVFIREALDNLGELSQRNRAEFKWYLTVTAARLLRKGEVARAAALAPAWAYPKVAYRVLGKKLGFRGC
jgi:glycosyltransferase involved in cell wall biosynthesis